MAFDHLVDDVDICGIDEWDQESGCPGIGLFASAVQVWAMAQDREEATVDEAALAFNVKPELIRQAVEHHPWMYLVLDNIEHDGE